MNNDAVNKVKGFAVKTIIKEKSNTLLVHWLFYSWNIDELLSHWSNNNWQMYPVLAAYPSILLLFSIWTDHCPKTSAFFLAEQFKPKVQNTLMNWKVVIWFDDYVDYLSEQKKCSIVKLKTENFLIWDIIELWFHLTEL